MLPSVAKLRLQGRRENLAIAAGLLLILVFVVTFKGGAASAGSFKGGGSWLFVYCFICLFSFQHIKIK